MQYNHEIGAMNRIICVLILLVTTRVFGAEPIDVPAPKKPFLLRFTDEPARAMHLTSLRSTNIDTSSKEMRIWIGFGVAYPEHMIRFEAQENGALKSESYLYYPAKLEDDKYPDKAEDHATMLADCILVGMYQKKAACKKNAHGPKAVQTTFDQLTAIGIWELPGADDIPPHEGDSLVLDGISMIVEIRSGNQYRAYAWSNPGFDSRPEARKAQAIIAALKGY
jgi:hypothetical protein